MTVQHIQYLDAKKVFDDIQNRIAKQKISYTLWKKVESVLESFEGKKITKRIETEITRLFPNYKVYYLHEHSMFSIAIWSNGVSYGEGSETFYLGYDKNPYFNIEEIRKSNLRYELEDSRSKMLESLAFDDIAFQVEKWNQGLTLLQEVNSWSESFELNYTSVGFDLNIR